MKTFSIKYYCSNLELSNQKVYYKQKEVGKVTEIKQHSGTSIEVIYEIHDRDLLEEISCVKNISVSYKGDL